MRPRLPQGPVVLVSVCTIPSCKLPIRTKPYIWEYVPESGLVRIRAQLLRVLRAPPQQWMSVIPPCDPTVLFWVVAGPACPTKRTATRPAGPRPGQGAHTGRVWTSRIHAFGSVIPHTGIVERQRPCYRTTSVSPACQVRWCPGVGWPWRRELGRAR